jgi:hypothetical protein
MGELKRRDVQAQEIFLSCVVLWTVGGRGQMRWEGGSAATLLGQLVFFIEFLTLSGLWPGGWKVVRCRTEVRMRRARPGCWEPGCCRYSRGIGATRP